jgi:hypothetical protein
MTETLTERIARQRKLREALKKIPTTAEDWKPLRDAEKRLAEIEYNRDLALRIRDRQVGSGMKRRG